MQQIATRIFIGASLAFGVLGILVLFIEPNQDSMRSELQIIFFKLFMSTIFVILPSFALSVAAKYLDGDRS